MQKLILNILFSCLFVTTLISCQKLDPSLLGSLEEGSRGDPSSVHQANGSITYGSNSQIMASGAYKMKGRLTSTMIDGGELASGAYKLKGKVRF